MSWSSGKVQATAAMGAVILALLAGAVSAFAWSSHVDQDLARIETQTHAEFQHMRDDLKLIRDELDDLDEHVTMLYQEMRDLKATVGLLEGLLRSRTTSLSPAVGTR